VTTSLNIDCSGATIHCYLFRWGAETFKKDRILCVLSLEGGEKKSGDASLGGIKKKDCKEVVIISIEHLPGKKAHGPRFTI